MNKASTRTKSVKISSRTLELYQKRDRNLDHSDVPQLPPALWLLRAEASTKRGRVGETF